MRVLLKAGRRLREARTPTLQVVHASAEMLERVNDLGGNFQIQSGADGAVITVSIPLASETSDAANSTRKKSAAGLTLLLFPRNYPVDALA